LFYMAELDKGLVSMTVTPVAVGDVFARVAAELAPRAAGKGIGWQVEVPQGLVVATDGDKLWRLVRALTDNAVQFTHAGAAQLIARPTAGGAAVENPDRGPRPPPRAVARTPGGVGG